MEFAYLDESGDPGAEGTMNMVLCLMVTSKNKELSQVIKWCRERLLQSKKGQKWLNTTNGAVKYHNFPDKSLLRQLVSKISKLEGSVYCIIFEKNRREISQEAKALIVNKLFQHIISSEGEVPVSIIADTGYFNTDKINFFLLCEYEAMKDELSLTVEKINESEYEAHLANGNSKCIKINHENTAGSKGLQVTDVIAGVIFHEAEHGDASFSSLLKGSILKLYCHTLRRK